MRVRRWMGKWQLAGNFLAALFVLSTFLIFSTEVQAQNIARIEGTLTDPSGAAVAGASIVAEPLGAAGATAKTRSGEDGKFSLAMEPGRYRVTIESAPFARMEQEFTLEAGDARGWNARLELEPLAANVTVTASSEPTTLETTAAPVDVITRSEIDERQETWITPLLASVGGASVSQLGPMGGSTTIFLDGGNSNYTKVLVDGAPVNQPGGLVDFSNWTSDSVDKIEVVHGAASALYGSDAMDGVVQIFTHRGTTRTPELLLDAEGGSFQSGHGGGRLSGELGAFDYSADASQFESNGQGPDDFYRDATLGGNFGWTFSPTDTLRLSVRNNSSDAGQPGQTLLGPEFTDLEQSTGLHDFSSDLSWNFSTSENWHYQLSGYETRFREREESSFGPFESMYNRAGLEGQATYLFHNGGATGGYMYEVENGPTEGRHNQAGYAETHYQFTRRLTAIAGVRAEDNGFFGTRVVPRAGANYAVRYGKGFWGATLVRASWGLGIKEPEILPSDCSPTLAPERSNTLDAGIEQALAGDRVHFSASYFHNDFYDIVSFATVETNPNCPAFGGSFFNTDKARADGANSTIEIKATNWLRILGNYTYDDSKVLAAPNAFDPALAPGNRLFKRPLHSADLIANAHFGRMNWNVGTYYVGRRTDSDFDGLGITSDGSYVRVDLANSIELGHGLSTEARVQNMLNRHYSDAVGYPALRLNYMVGMRYRWGGR
jgi:vitamin B12 transporter